MALTERASQIGSSEDPKTNEKHQQREKNDIEDNVSIAPRFGIDIVWSWPRLDDTKGRWLHARSMSWNSIMYEYPEKL